MNRFLLAGLLLCASCAPREEKQVDAIPLFDVTALKGGAVMREVEGFVTLGPKVPGTEASRRAAAYIEQRVHVAGLMPERDEFIDRTPVGNLPFINVTATLPGNQPGVVIIAAHWDTKAGIEGFVGANDSGSGVGLLLAMAPLLKAGSTDRPSIMLAFLDGEECRVDYGPHDGLHGSRHLVAKLKEAGRAGEVRAFILLDMIGDRNLSVAIPRNGTPELIAKVFHAAEREGKRGCFSLGVGGVLDDHQPFLDAGIPAVDLIDFDYGSAPGLNDYWHTAADTLDKLSPVSLETVGRVVLRVLESFRIGSEPMTGV